LTLSTSHAIARFKSFYQVHFFSLAKRDLTNSCGFKSKEIESIRNFNDLISWQTIRFELKSESGIDSNGSIWNRIISRRRYRIIVIEFVNDINILIYETSTKNTCKTLKKAHVECELWTRRHEARFASIKYELMHLTKNHRRFNMTTIININEVIKKSFISMKMLKMQLDIKFKWNSHVKKIHEKMTTQMLAFTRLTAST
jgi:hypothetical protein